MLRLRVEAHCQLPGLCRMEEAKAALAKRAPTKVTQSGASKFTRPWEFQISPTTSELVTESFDSKLADAGNRLVRQLGRYLR